MNVIRTCNDTYLRDASGWHYPWGAPVPGARDLTVADVLAVGADPCAGDPLPGTRPLTATERRWLRGEPLQGREAARLLRAGRRADPGDLIVGMTAPELHPSLLLGIDDLARCIGVSRATIDSYRARDRVVRPQVVLGRTPLWTRPIIEHWVGGRHGATRPVTDGREQPLVADG